MLTRTVATKPPEIAGIVCVNVAAPENPTVRVTVTVAVGVSTSTVPRVVPLPYSVVVIVLVPPNPDVIVDMAVPST